MRPPCEIVVSKVLPAIRTVLVKDLIDRHGFSQKEVSEELGVTQAAVSQYLGSVRGDAELERKFSNSEIFEKIRDLSDEIASGNLERSQILEEFCDICETMRKKGIFREIYSDNAPSLT